MQPYSLDDGGLTGVGAARAPEAETRRARENFIFGKTGT